MMASGSHAAMGSEASHVVHSASSVGIASGASEHSDHANLSAAVTTSVQLSDTNCIDDSSCVAGCAAHCTAGAVTGSQVLVATSIAALHAPLVNHRLKSAVILDLYKPPKTLH